MFKQILQSGAAQKRAAWALARYVVLAARTTRWRIVGAEHLAAFAAGPPAIVVFWHDSLPAMPIFWLAARRLGLRRRAVVLASQHRDGRLIGAAVGHLGIGMAAGSSSRGGAAGLRSLITALRDGAHAGLTPDGPRGPRRAAAAGVAQLAALTGAPVLPCAAWTAKAITLNSWDRMRLPLPFGRGTLVCGPAISVARQNWASALPAIQAGLDAAMAAAEAGS
jgi:lysophospholipid acyltransferase (LPLAT)-like uncharacterized protein